MTGFLMPAFVADVARIQARERPGACAIDFQGRRTSFFAFNQAASRCANALIAAGVKPGDRIAVLAKGCDDFFVLWLGALKARACLAPVNWRLAAPEIAFIVKDAGARLFVFGEAYREVVERLRGELPAVEMAIGLESATAEAPAFRDWIAQFPDHDPMLAPRDDDDVIQLYTSGTTGLPKGVQLSEANYRALFASATQGWGRFDPLDAVLVAMPLFHVAGTNMGLLALLQGACAIVLAEADPGAILEAIERHAIRQAFLVPALINMVLQHPAMDEAKLASLEKVYYGASPISEEVLRNAQQRFGAQFTQLYGLTETNGAGTWLSPQAHAEGRLRACGVAQKGIEVRVRTEGREARNGEVGEVEIRAGTVMKGYWNRPEATAEAIDAQGWFRTGDAGFFDAEGYLHIHDRVKDMIVSGGENVYPAEVENALFAHPAVADAAVIGVPDERWGEAVKAIVVLKPGAAAEPGAIIAHCRERIAGFKTPKSIDFTEVLPRNPSGKVLRRQLREPYWTGRDRRVG